MTLVCVDYRELMADGAINQIATDDETVRKMLTRLARGEQLRKAFQFSDIVCVSFASIMSAIQSQPVQFCRSTV